MVVLFVAHHIDHLVDGVVVETHLGSTDILCHIHARTIGTEQQLLVESLIGEVGPHTIILMALEKTVGQSFLYFSLSFEVGLRFVIDLIEAYTEFLVSLIETGIYPVVHLLPQGTHLGVVLLPLHEHLMGFLNERSLLLGFLLIHALSHEFLNFLTVVLIEEHVVVANEVIAFLAAALRCFAITPFQPSQHRLTDMNTAVVHDIGLHYLVTVGCHDLCQRPPKEVVAYMS